MDPYGLQLSLSAQVPTVCRKRLGVNIAVCVLGIPGEGARDRSHVQEVLQGAN